MNWLADFKACSGVTGAAIAVAASSSDAKVIDNFLISVL
jgi:hypothetical protein